MKLFSIALAAFCLMCSGVSNSDSPTMSAEWKTYRQALRDITKQTPKLNETNDDGPLDITWPTEPS